MGIPLKTAERSYEKGIMIQMKKTEKKEIMPAIVR